MPPTEQAPVEQAPRVESALRLRHIPGYGKLALLGAGVSAVFLTAAACNGVFSEHTSITASGGEGTVTSVYALDTECHAGYIAPVDGASATSKTDIKVLGHHVPGSDQKSTITGHIGTTGQICNNGSKVKVIKTFSDRTATGTLESASVSIPRAAFSIAMWRTNYGDKGAFSEPHDNFLQGMIKGWGTQLKHESFGFLGPDDPTKSKSMNLLEDIIVLKSFQTASVACGSIAWDMGARAIYIESQKQYLANILTLPESKITVNVPEHIKFDNPYKNQLDRVVKQNNNSHISFDPGKVGSCKPSKGLIKQGG